MTLGRRDLIKFASGGVCGVALTPLPWKLLDDTANWSQNWSWIPKVPRGELKVKYSTCTICPAGCGVKARCVADRAVGIEGAAAHPFSRGVLCPTGFGAHTLAYHAKRLRPNDKQPAQTATIASRIAKGGRVAILDLGPERAVSALHRKAVESFGNAVYLRLPDRQEATLNAVAELIGRAPGSLGLDLTHTRTIVSFGAPVLERWSTPGLVMERWCTGDLRVVQIEPRQSRTALAAETWIPSLALRMPEGLKLEPPAVIIGSGDDPVQERTIAEMNLALGAVGNSIVARAALPWPASSNAISSVPDGSIDVLFVDSSRTFDPMPWPLIGRKLKADALVVALAYKEDAFTAQAAIVLPVAAPFESVEDAGTASCAAIPSFSIGAPLIDSPVVRESPVDHLNAVLQAAGKAPVGTVAEELKRRVSLLHEAGDGSVVSYADGTVTKLEDIASPDALLKKLQDGACWMGERSDAKLATKAITAAATPLSPKADPGRALTLIVFEAPDDSAPLASKLYQESGLYTPKEIARINPETAVLAGLAPGTHVVIETACGSRGRQLLLDPAVMPGVVEASGDIDSICTDGSAPNWRRVPANVRRA